MKANIAAVGLGHPFEVGFDQAEAVVQIMAENGFEVFDELVENDWCALAVRKK